MAFGWFTEFINYQPVPYHLRAMGYWVELKALGTRRNRCQSEWQPHLEKTQALILEASELCAAQEKALIIGSGLLFDIPLAELSRRFKQVVLVDIIHLGRVRRQVKRYPNVRLLQLDVTGVVEQIYAMARGWQPVRIPQYQPDSFLDEGFDLVVSANILSQLAVIPNGFMSRRIKHWPDLYLQKFSRGLVENHLHWLAAFSGVVCLIADLERLTCSGAKLIRREESLWGVRLPPGRKEWCWDLAPCPEIDVRYDIRHRVAGYANFPKQAWLANGLFGVKVNPRHRDIIDRGY